MSGAVSSRREVISSLDFLPHFIAAAIIANNQAFKLDLDTAGSSVSFKLADLSGYIPFVVWRKGRVRLYDREEVLIAKKDNWRYVEIADLGSERDFVHYMGSSADGEFIHPLIKQYLLLSYAISEELNKIRLPRDRKYPDFVGRLLDNVAFLYHQLKDKLADFTFLSESELLGVRLWLKGQPDNVAALTSNIAKFADSASISSGSAASAAGAGAGASISTENLDLSGAAPSTLTTEPVETPKTVSSASSDASKPVFESSGSVRGASVGFGFIWVDDYDSPARAPVPAARAAMPLPLADTTNSPPRRTTGNKRTSSQREAGEVAAASASGSAVAFGASHRQLRQRISELTQVSASFGLPASDGSENAVSAALG